MSKIYVDEIAGIASADTVAIPGHVIQVVQTYKTDVFTMSLDEVETDITGLSATITPSSSSSKILVVSTVQWSSNVSQNAVLALKRGSTYLGNSTVGTARNGFSFSNVGVTDNRLLVPSNTMYLDSPSTTSATTYKVTAWADNAELFTINRRALNANYGASSHITLMEIAG